MRVFAIMTFLLSTSIIFGQRSLKDFSSEHLNYSPKLVSAGQSTINDLRIYGLAPENELRLHHNHTYAGKDHIKYHQYYEGLRVLGGTQIYHTDAGQVYSESGKLYQVKNINTTPSLSKEAGRQAAERALATMLLSHDHSHEDHGHDHSHGEWKMPVTKSIDLAVADAKFPLESGKYVLTYIYRLVGNDDNFPVDYNIYVDAHTGDVIRSISNIEGVTVTGTGTGYYHENLSFPVDSIAPDQFILRDLTRGQGIFTYDLSKNLEEFTDDDNVWEYESRGGQAALDGYVATVAYYDFLLDKFNRNSIDGNGFPLSLNLNRNTFVNAFWNGQEATFGNGNCGSYGPLTTYEIVSHEFTHGLTDYTSNLIYAFESGALNESMSDIFGKGLEYFYDNDHFNWYIGQALPLSPSGNPFRSMIDPTERFDPKYYLGQYWVFRNSDAGGVHSNSGVLNHWFYLLVEGGTGITQDGYEYNIDGIGMDDALQICYQMQAAYLTENSGYSEAFTYSRASVIDLFGANSPIMASVEEAWKAVGLDEANLNDGRLDLTLSYESGSSVGPEYCLSDLADMEVTFNNYTDVILPVGTTIKGVFNLDYQNVPDPEPYVIDITLEEELVAGGAFGFPISEVFSENPGSIFIGVESEIITPDNRKFYYNTSQTLSISEISEAEVALNFTRHNGGCDGAGNLSFEYFVIDLPICGTSGESVITFTYAGPLGTESVEEVIPEGGPSDVTIFDPAQRIPNIESLGNIKDLIFTITHSKNGVTSVIYEEAFDQYYGELIPANNKLTFDSDEDADKLIFDLCGSCEISTQDANLTILNSSGVNGIESCIPLEDYKGFGLPTSRIDICINTNDFNNPGLVFDAQLLDNPDYPVMFNDYLHILDVEVNEESIMDRPIFSTDNTFKKYAVPLPSGIEEVSILVYSRSTTISIDNILVRGGVFSTGIEDEKELSISYQNPTSESIDVMSASALPTGTVATLYDTDGRLLLKQNVQGNYSNIDVSSLSNGMYILNLQHAGTDNFNWSGKVIVAK